MSGELQFTRLADVPTVEAEDGIYSLVVKNGSVAKIEGGAGGAGIYDEIVDITFQQKWKAVYDEEGELDGTVSESAVQTSIPINDIIAKLKAGKSLGARVKGTMQYPCGEEVDDDGYLSNYISIPVNATSGVKFGHADTTHAPSLAEYDGTGYVLFAMDDSLIPAYCKYVFGTLFQGNHWICGFNPDDL